MKEERRIRNSPTMRISFKTFLLIFCRTWFHWSTPLDQIRSFRKVGIRAPGLRPDLVNRTKFTIGDLDAEDDDIDPIDTTVPSPVGVRRGSLEYYKRKLETAIDVIGLMDFTPPLPKEAGILETTPQPAAAQEYISERAQLYEEEYGSYTLKQMGVKKKAKRKAAQVERERIDTTKAGREKKKVDAVTKQLALEFNLV